MAAPPPWDVVPGKAPASDYQLVNGRYNGWSFGAGTPWVITQADGVPDMMSLKTQDTDHPGDGESFGQDWEGKRIITVELSAALAVTEQCFAVLPPGYYEQVRADGPLGYWRLGEASGPTAVDLSGHGLDGAYSASGIAYQAPGALRTSTDAAVTMDGVNGLVTVAAPPVIPAGAPFTVEAWGRRTGLPADWRGLFLVGQGPGAGALVMWINDEMLNFGVTGPAGEWQFIYSWDKPISGDWYHCVGTFDGATIRMYLNSVEQGYNRSVVTGPTHGPWYVGSSTVGGAGNRWQGDLDEVAVYPVALTPERIRAHYLSATGTTVPPPAAYAQRIIADGPTGYWRLGEASGPTAADLSPRRLNGVYSPTGITHATPGALATSPDRGITMDGTALAASVVSASVLAPGGSWSIEAWVNPAQTEAYIGIFEEPLAIKLWVSNGAVGVGVTGPLPDSLWQYVLSPVPIRVGEWSHVVATFDGTTVRLYMNAVLVADLTAVTGSTGDTWNIGVAFGANYWLGGLDEVAFYSYPLNLATIQAHYELGTVVMPVEPPAPIPPPPRRLEEARCACMRRQSDLPLELNGRWVVMARPRRFVFPQRQAALSALTVSWEAQDPTLYAIGEQSGQASLGLGTRGRSYPRNYPWRYGSGVGAPGFIVRNDGCRRTFLRCTISGPVENPIIVNGLTFEKLELRLTLSGTDYLDIDMRECTVLLNGTVSRYYNLTADSTWWACGPGDTPVYYENRGPLTASTMTARWRSAW